MLPRSPRRDPVLPLLLPLLLLPVAAAPVHAEDGSVGLAAVAIGADGYEPMRLFEPAWNGIRALAECVPAAAAATEPEVNLVYTIESDGSATAVNIRSDGTTLQDAAALACVQDRVQALSFYAREGRARVAARLVLRFAIGSGQPAVSVVDVTTREPAPLLLLGSTTHGDDSLAYLLGDVPEPMAFGAIDDASMDSQGGGLGAVDAEAGRAYGIGGLSAGEPEHEGPRNPPDGQGARSRTVVELVRVDGPQDETLLAQTFRRRHRNFTACHERWLRETGDLRDVETLVTLSIAANGRPDDIEVAETSGAAGDLTDCLEQVLVRFRFPATPDGATNVTMRLVLTVEIAE